MMIIWDTGVLILFYFRAASSPLKTLEGHTKGILSLAWCKDDSDLLLSCGKDNRIIVWNPNSAQVVLQRFFQWYCSRTTTNQYFRMILWENYNKPICLGDIVAKLQQINISGWYCGRTPTNQYFRVILLQNCNKPIFQGDIVAEL